MDKYIFFIYKKVEQLFPKQIQTLINRIKISSIGYRFASGMFWNLIGMLVSRGAILISMIFIARLLKKEIFGQLAIVQSTIATFQIFAEFGMGLTTAKYVAEFKTTSLEKTGRIILLSNIVVLIISFILSTILFLLSPFLAAKILVAPHLKTALQISAFLFLLISWNAVQTGILVGLEAFRSITNVNLLGGICSFFLLIICTYFGKLNGAVLGLALSAGFNALLNYIFLQKEIKKNNISFLSPIIKEDWKILINFSLPVVLTGLMITLANWTCNTILINKVGYAELGIFNAANQWFLVLIFLPRVVSQVTLPILSDYIGKKNKVDASKLFSLSVKINAIISIFLVLILSFLSPMIMSCYGEGFSNSWPVLIVVLFTSALVAIHSPCADLITASGSLWSGLVINLGWSLIFIGLTIFLIKFGGMGLVTSRFIAYFIHTILLFLFIKKIFNQKKFN
ncbi:MAG: oligosaccharide flippase family protein [bacterium]